MPDRPILFISHSHTDFRVAARLQDLLAQSSGNGFELERSSEKGAIRSGESWRAWIDDKVLRCDVAIVILTPSSFRGRWVLWEAGAVTGVQYERLKGQDLNSEDPLARRVRVVRFNLRDSDLGPFASGQVRDGLDAQDMQNFVDELLEEFQSRLNSLAYRKGIRESADKVAAFISQVKEDLRYSPLLPEEGLIQDWLARIEEARARDDFRWIIAAKRWINVAFLGANNAEAHRRGDAIDFRIHSRIAEAHRRLKEWDGVVEQLQLAAKLSPNDLVVLRDLGRAYRELERFADLDRTLEAMELLDPDIFREDREGIGIRCGYFAKLERWSDVEKLLAEADQTIVSMDPYLANWHAIATMKVHGSRKSAALFERLRDLLRRTGKGFWDDATLMNALLAIDPVEAAAKLQTLGLSQRPQDEIASATRFYDDIVAAFGHDLEWRKVAGLASERVSARP